ncbi:hypothetical protein CDAR_298081 [Caerostris darwini]|uniref:Uncharacterized protein n=1 Tax=Caerostris darwini TaxID=1538125 RepID=A0AAV4Q1C5_9ARAC|nr:hypothetical protein CDAR_298081 [Caerostris darwini]
MTINICGYNRHRAFYFLEAETSPGDSILSPAFGHESCKETILEMYFFKSYVLLCHAASTFLYHCDYYQFWYMEDSCPLPPFHKPNGQKFRHRFYS